MGLIAHYKLDGNANDALGKYNGTASNVTWVDGKLGQAGSFNGSDSGVTTSDFRALFRNEMSVSMWVKFIDDSRGILFGNYDGTSGLNVEKNGGYKLRFWYNGNPDFNTADNVVSVNTWHHVTFIRSVKDSMIHIYVDGKKVGSTTNIGTWSNAGLNSFYIGRDSRTGSTVVNGLIDDVRIYDHALSEREVRDLSQGLVLHYTFDQFQEPTENGFTNPIFSGTAGWSSTQGSIIPMGDEILSLRRSVSGTGDFQLYQVIPFSVGQVTTISFKCKKVEGTGAGTNSFGFGIGVWGMTPTWSMTRVSTEDIGNGWYKLTYVLPAATNSSGGAVTGINSMTNNLVDTYHIKEIQYERKSYASPFVNGTRAGIVRDQSTQGNDAPLALANTPKWVEGGMVGKGCYEFDGVDDEILSSHSSANISSDKASFCAWVYHNQRSSSYSTIIHKSAQYSISVCSSTGGLTYSDSTAWGYSSFGCHGVVPLNTWTHISAVRNGTSVILYINGVQVVAKTTGTVINTTTNPLYIGAYKDTNYLPNYWKGQIDDVRIYTTALSAEEIKELYQQRASLDSGGNLLC